MKYTLTKLAGAGFLLSCLSLLFILGTDGNLYDYTETFSDDDVLLIIFVYSIFCSILIDIIVLKLSRIADNIRVPLYLLFGFILFPLISWDWYGVFAGIIGAAVANIYFLATLFAKRNSWFRYLFAVMIPVVFLITLTMDFTEKQNWEEHRQHNTYQASFAYFDGKHEIPLELTKGDVVYFSVNTEKLDGGHGYHVKNKFGKLVGMHPHGDQSIITAEKSGEYRIVIKGHQANGSFSVDWKIQ
ncbi:hypothetical protein [Gracilibacillus kekensis]|uniref:Uncharacterized protein n=1 Tax=Gracilibacillus kekensis TaxID=1027249 RepID=A0A1M7NU02_9BACI|nr:hypothetical protein [Gracilibacillus kekensis]SHN07516.1 hypothetical protein SAMN05216179_1761 [Gracilibacillus kekensis]